MRVTRGSAKVISVAGRTGLLERDAGLAAIRDCLAQARAGRGRAVFLVGAAGLGKTSLLAAAVEQARDTMDVGAAGGAVMQRAIPFGLVQQALDELDPEHGLWLADPGGGDTGAPYFRLLRWLEETHGSRPLLLVLDDLHWADEDSLRLITFVVRRIRRLPLALVGGLRPWPAEALELCEGLAHSGDATVEHLSPLGPDAVATVLAARSHVDVSAESAQRAYQLCQGNPLLAEELARGLARGEDIPHVGGPTPGLAHQLLLTRFAGLDENGLRCARTASVLGHRFDLTLVPTVADVEPAAADLALDALYRSQLVSSDRDGRARFVHPLFAQALYDDIAEPVRQRLHARAYRLLAERGEEAEATEHAMRAGLSGDAAAAGLLERAGRAALVGGAPATAVRALEAASRTLGNAASPALVLTHAEALIANGALEEAAGRCRSLLDAGMSSWSEEIEVRCLLGRALYLTGAADHGEEMLRTAAELAIKHDATRAVQPLLDQSLAAWLAGGTRRALPLASWARELAQGADRMLWRRAEASWGHLAFEAGDPAGLAVTTALDAELTSADRGPMLAPAELTWPWASVYQFAMNATYAERYEDAERAFHLTRAVTAEAGAVGALANIAIHLAGGLVRRGRLSEALAEAEKASEFAELTPGVLPYARLARAEALLWLGRAEESEHLCALTLDDAGGQWFASLWVAHLRGARMLWAGDPATSDELLRAERISTDVGIGEPCHLWWAGHAVDAHLMAGRAADAERVVAWLDERAAALPCRWPRIAAAVGHSLLAVHHGDSLAAESGLRRALDLDPDGALPLVRIETLLAYGRFLRRASRNVEARAPLAAALRLCEDVGAAGLHTTIADELRLAGGRRRTARSDPQELTDAQRRVAALAAGGASNAEIARRLYLSVNTVQSHLKQVYAKLGIESRRVLMVRWREDEHGADRSNGAH